MLWTNLLKRIIVDIGAIALVSRVTVVTGEARLARLVMIQVVAHESGLHDLTAIKCILCEGRIVYLGSLTTDPRRQKLLIVLGRAALVAQVVHVACAVIILVVSLLIHRLFMLVNHQFLVEHMLLAVD